MKRKLTRIIVFIIFILILHTNIFAAGRSRAEFLCIDTGGRPAGMAGAFSAVSDDVNGIFYNPAGLGWMEETQITFQHNAGLEDISQNYAAGAYKLDIGVLGISVNYFNLGKMTGRASQVDNPYTFDASQMATTLSLGKRLGPSFAVGAGLKTIQEKIEDESSSGWAVDFGLIKQMNEYRFGVLVQNLGPEMRFIEKREDLPSTFKIGVARNFQKLIVAFDGNFPMENSAYYSFGFEYQLIDILSIRGGYQLDKNYESGVGLTAGLGLSLKNYRFDYSYMPFDDLGDTHKISIIYSFK